MTKKKRPSKKWIRNWLEENCEFQRFEAEESMHFAEELKEALEQFKKKGTVPGNIRWILDDDFKKGRND